MQNIIKKTFFVFSIISSSILSNSQGIQFEEGTSWKDIVLKARNEHKYIFLDFYTTWCMPCKMMSKKVFTKKEVGDFFNANFLSVAIQCDTTETDNDFIKASYSDAHSLMELYRINSYPTYLFFDSEGKLINSMYGASKDEKDFLISVKAAIGYGGDVDYLGLKKRFQNGEKDTSLLLSLIEFSRKLNDNLSLHLYIDHYLVTQNNLLTERNLKFIAEVTDSSSDIGFPVLLNNELATDNAIGANKRFSILNRIIFDEDILPVITINGSKKNMGGGMIIYGGEINEKVDWVALKKRLQLKYGNISEQIILSSQLTYYEWKKDWTSLNKILSEYVATKIFNIELINKYAWKITTYCEDKAHLKQAINWASVLLNFKKTDNYLYTYSRLLYKAGLKNTAIKYMKKYNSYFKLNDDENILQQMIQGKEIE